jgi:hypothetical protein
MKHLALTVKHLTLTLILVICFATTAFASGFQFGSPKTSKEAMLCELKERKEIAELKGQTSAVASYNTTINYVETLEDGKKYRCGSRNDGKMLVHACPGWGTACYKL